MKKIVIIFILLSFQLNVAQENKWKFDIKTKMKQKSDITGMKKGLILYLNNSTWAKVVERGEHYCVWITNLTRTPKNDSIKIIRFDYELTEASAFRKKPAIKNRYYDLEYNINTDWIGKFKSPEMNRVMAEYEGAKEFKALFGTALDLTAVATDFMLSGGFPIVSGIMKSFKKDKTETELKIQKVEATIVAYALYFQLIKWINEIEAQQ